MSALTNLDPVCPRANDVKHGNTSDQDLKGGSLAVKLETLSVAEVCNLLEHCQLGAIIAVAKENQFSGLVEHDKHISA